MFGRQALPSAALAAIFGAALFAVSCAQPGGGTSGAAGSSGSGAAGSTGITCTAPQRACSQGCTNVQTDTQNCGACGAACSAGQSCVSGVCGCSSGLLSCSGQCVSSDATHCGSCTVACTGSQVCSNNACSSTCATGQTACTGGACANLQTDNGNCGSCGKVCSGGSTCNAGTCTCATAGQLLCGTACTDTTSNTANCGSCGHACTTGQTCTNSACVNVSTTGTAGTNGSGTAGTTGSTGTAGTKGAAGSTGAAGTTGTAGTTGSTGTAGSGARACAPASANVISDFEDGTGDEVVQGGRQGWWYVFADTLGGSQTPAANAAGPIAAAAATDVPPGDTAMCDKYAMHSTATGHSASNTSSYEGFGVSLAQILPPPASGSKTKNAFDVSTFDGISFNIKSGSGTAPPVWFELGNTETQPAPDGTATNNAVDEYNTRGKLLSTIGTSWTTVYIPFGLLAPRYLPSLTASGCSNAATICQAPAWNPKSLLGMQFSVYPQFSTSTLNYDLWVDDVTLYTGSNGLATVAATGGTPAHAFPLDAAVGSCTKPTGASGKYLADMYVQWKAKFVTGSGASTRVQRPENSNDTVSEGIGYGMLIAVAFGDKTLFDGLWSYSQAHVATGMLMTWDISSGGGNAGTGSATDADEDMAYALIEAGKQWGGTYAATAKTMIGQIFTSDIDATALLPTGGSNYGSVTSKVTNPSYFAPYYYRVFAGVDTTHTTQWNTIASNVYSAISNIEAKVGTAGLIPAWCSSSGSSTSTICNGVGSNGAADDGLYQYDAHRVPWRIGLDYCFNGSSVPASGKTFLTNNASFFASKSATGVGRLVDIYTLSGGPNSDAEPNSMSAVGTAGVSAMAVGNAFANTAYHFVLDASYTPASFIPDTGGKIAYTYFNASVGLMTALTMSGNFPTF